MSDEGDPTRDRTTLVLAVQKKRHKVCALSRTRVFHRCR